MFRLGAVRHACLGLDRDYTSYWYFPDLPRIYCLAKENRWGYFANPAEVWQQTHTACITWQVVTGMRYPTQLDDIINSLNIKGIREFHLRASLIRHHKAISSMLRRKQEVSESS